MAEGKEKSAKRARASSGTTASALGKRGTAVGQSIGGAVAGKLGVGLNTGEDHALVAIELMKRAAASSADFMKSVQDYQQFMSDVDQRLKLVRQMVDETNKERERKLADAEAEHQRELRRRRLDLEVELRSYTHAEIVKALADQGEVPINANELAKLRTELDTMKAQNDAFQARVVAEADARRDTELRLQEERIRLQHRVEMADKEAKLLQNAQEIKILKENLIELRGEMNAATARRDDLTKAIVRDIASAGKYAAPAPSAAPTTRG